MIEFACPHCNSVLQIPEKYSGKRGTCKKCGNGIVVAIGSASPLQISKTRLESPGIEPRSTPIDVLKEARHGDTVVAGQSSQASLAGHTQARGGNTTEALGWLGKRFADIGGTPDPTRIATAILEGDNDAIDSLFHAAESGNGQALRLLLKLGEEGIAEIQFRLGAMYQSGKGVNRDNSAALYWFMRATIRGHAQALAVLEKAAEEGDAKAVERLVRAAKEGQTKAAEWLWKAATRGDAQALNGLIQLANEGDSEVRFQLGSMYHTGIGGTRGDTQSMYWMMRAADLGHERSLEWITKAAEGGHAEAAWLLSNHFGRIGDRANWWTWAEKAAELGHAEGRRRVDEVIETVKRQSSAEENCPPPERCAKCGESLFILTNVSPNIRSADWTCSYCKRVERVLAHAALEPNSVNYREPIAKAVQREVWRRDEGKCVECGSNENLEYDHIIPISRGGSNTVRNIQILCQVCNRKKSAKEPGNY